MPTDLETYRQTLTDLYLRLPDTPRRLSRFDLRLVRQLWDCLGEQFFDQWQEVM